MRFILTLVMAVFVASHAYGFDCFPGPDDTSDMSPVSKCATIEIDIPDNSVVGTYFYFRPQGYQVVFHMTQGAVVGLATCEEASEGTITDCTDFLFDTNRDGIVDSNELNGVSNASVAKRQLPSVITPPVWRVEVVSFSSATKLKAYRQRVSQ